MVCFTSRTIKREGTATMNHPPPTEQQTGKRIVSKGEYVKVQGKRAGLSVVGTGLMLLAVICGFTSFFFLLQLVFAFVTPSTEFGDFVMYGLLALIFAGATYLLGQGSTTSIQKAQKLGQIQPLTRANTANLPAPDSLVRASAEPVQEQHAVLLRAATQTQERHEEQLVRAAGVE